MQWRDAILEGRNKPSQGAASFSGKQPSVPYSPMPQGPSLAAAVVPAAMLSLPLGYFSPKIDFKTYKDMTALWLITVTIQAQASQSQLNGLEESQSQALQVSSL